jgi:ABC-type transporter lipoprotein component MlaA
MPQSCLPPCGQSWSHRLKISPLQTRQSSRILIRLQAMPFKEAEDSIDFYPFLRSAYYQTRRADLREALGLPPLVESPATTPSR